MTLCMAYKCPKGVMLKILLKSDEFEGIKNPPPQISMTFLEFLLELMMILSFLTGAAVLDEVLHGQHMP